MSRIIFLSFFAPIILLFFLLSGCSNSAGPSEIAFQPLNTPIAIYPPQPKDKYRAYLEISAIDVDIATARAAQIIHEFDGYIVGSSTWYSGNQKSVQLEIEVPFRNFGGLHTALLGLGKMLREYSTGESVYQSYEGDQTNANMLYINLIIIPKDAASTHLFQIGDWNPLSTFRVAFNVFLKIFGFIVDVMIWIVVVFGPFLLIGLGIRWLIRRRTRTTLTE
jgi:Domain of unknown function (DUF4349)